MPHKLYSYQMLKDRKERPENFNAMLERYNEINKEFKKTNYYNPKDGKKFKSIMEMFHNNSILYNEFVTDNELNITDTVLIPVVEYQLSLEKENQHKHPITGKELRSLDEIFNIMKDGQIPVIKPKKE